MVIVRARWPVTGVRYGSSGVIEAHRVADVAHRLLGQLARTLAAVRDDVADELRIVEVALGPLPDRRQLRVDRIDHRLLAVETADAGGRAALPHPVAARLVRVDLVQRPDGAA